MLYFCPVKLKRIYIILVLAALVLSSCSKHQKLLKSSDNEAKYAAAIQDYENHDYYRALQLFQQLINFYQGTEKAQKMQFYYAYCYYYQKDYILASYYFKRFTTNYPRSEYAEEAMYMNAYCYYLDSPPFSLDQTNTYTAINELQLFIDTYPNSDRVEECTNLIDRLREKLQKKAFNAANLYYKMQQYEAAITSYNTMLNDYPGTDYKEEILFNILKSYYYYGLKSIQSKQAERYQAALDAYNEFIFQYPDSKFLKDANAIRDQVKEKIESEQLTSKSK